MEISVLIEGISPLITKNGRTANPLDPFAKALKRCSSKRNKTDEDHAFLSNIEFHSGLYVSPQKALSVSEQGEITVGDCKLIIPAHVLDSVLREGSRKLKLGKQASAGTRVLDDGVLMVNGSDDPKKILEDEEYRRFDIVKVGQAKVVRCRPCFTNWTVSFGIYLDESVIESEQVKHALEQAGKLVGIGDWRPGAPRGGGFGRFMVEEFKVVGEEKAGKKKKSA